MHAHSLEDALKLEDRAYSELAGLFSLCKLANA